LLNQAVCWWLRRQSSTVRELVGELSFARDLPFKKKLSIALSQHLPLPSPSDTVGNEVAIVSLSTRLPDFVVGDKVCRSGELPCLFQQVGPSKGNVFGLVCLRNDLMKAKLSIAVLEKV
jgi:hypothetical protein